MPLIPLLGLILPSAIHLAESLFVKSESEPSRGAEKKAFVMDLLSKLFDFFKDQGKVPEWADKKMILDVLGVFVDRLVPEVTHA